MQTENLLARLAPKLGTGIGERPFLTDVIAKMPDDAFDQTKLDAQRHFLGIDGGNCWMDFCIVESDEVRVSIEIDGYDKRGTGTFERRDWQAWLHRQNALVAQGWRVVRLANAEVLNNPRRCARVVLGTLREARKVAHHGQALTRAIGELELARAGLVCAEAERGVAQSQLDELRQLLLEKQEAVSVATSGDASLAGELKEGDLLRAEQDAALLKDLQGEVDGMKSLGKWFAAAMVLIVAMVIGFLVYFTERSTPPLASAQPVVPQAQVAAAAPHPGFAAAPPPQVPAALPVPSSPTIAKAAFEPEPRVGAPPIAAPAEAPPLPQAGPTRVASGPAPVTPSDPCAGDVQWDRASECEGRVVTVVGALAGIKEMGEQTALNLGRDYPKGFRVFLRTKTGAPQDATALVGKTVRTTGKIVSHVGKHGTDYEIVQKSWRDVRF